LIRYLELNPELFKEVKGLWKMIEWAKYVKRVFGDRKISYKEAYDLSIEETLNKLES
jgi:hypothetical protein